MKLLTTLALGLLTLSDYVLARKYSNPLKPNEGGDPDIEFHDGYYYLVATNYRDLRQTRATTLEGLKTGEQRLVHDPVNDPEDARCQIWAPEQHQIDGIWYIYYAAGPCSNWEVTDQYTYVLKGGPSLWDEFTWIGKVNTPAFAIDSTVAVIENKDYFIYSCFRTEGGLTEASLCIADMFDPLTVGEEHLLSFPSDAWECVGDCVAEGPHALQRNGKTFLTYAGGSCSAPEYALGMLTYIGGDPLLQTSWQKAPEPVFRGTANVTSTGHNSFFKSPDGTEDWIVYHTTPFAGGSCQNDRMVNAKKVDWDANGDPVFGIPPNYGEELDGPSGEPAQAVYTTDLPVHIHIESTAKEPRYMLQLKPVSEYIAPSIVTFLPIPIVNWYDLYKGMNNNTIPCK